LSHELRHRDDDFPCEEGGVLVVEVLEQQVHYNTLELTSGRMAKVSRGDVIVGALGHRRALFGYSVTFPTCTGRRHRADAEHRRRARHLRLREPDKGKPFDARVLGCVLQFPFLGERIGVPAPRRVQRLDAEATLDTHGCARRRARRHLHGGRQDGRGLCASWRACVIAD
jgi:hypothetical protein